MQKLKARALSADATFRVSYRHGFELICHVDLSGREQVVLPASLGLRQLVMEELHCSDLGGHLGSKKTVAAL